MDIKSINNSFVNGYIPNCLFYNEEEKEEKKKKRRKKKNEISAKNANGTKTTTQQSSTGILYHPTVPFFSFIWSFSPK